MPGALLVDEMGLGKTFTSVAVAMFCKPVTEKVVMGLPRSIVWGNTTEQWVSLAHNDCPGIVSEEQEWNPLQRLNTVPRRLLEFQSTLPHGQPVLISPAEPILVVTMHQVAEILKRVIGVMIHETDFKLINRLHTETVNLTHIDLNTSIDEPHNRRNIHLVSYDTLKSRV
jgi:hypothetical protein